MKFAAYCSLLAAALISSYASHARPRAEQLEIMGLKIGTPQSQVEARLRADGYTFKNEVSGWSCSRTYQSIMAELVKNARTDFNRNVIGCGSRFFTKGTSIVDISYLISPNGWVLQNMGYQFYSTDTPQAINAQLEGKFGPSQEGFRPYSSMSWFTSNQGVGTPYLRYSNLNNNQSHVLTMGAGADYAETFYKEVQKDLERRLPKVKAVL